MTYSFFYSFVGELPSRQLALRYFKRPLNVRYTSTW